MLAFLAILRLQVTLTIILPFEYLKKRKIILFFSQSFIESYFALILKLFYDLLSDFFDGSFLLIKPFC